jgi:hypothetical protein
MPQLGDIQIRKDGQKIIWAGNAYVTPDKYEKFAQAFIKANPNAPGAGKVPKSQQSLNYDQAQKDIASGMQGIRNQRLDPYAGNAGLVNGQLRSDLQMGSNPIWQQMLEGNLGRQGFEENQMLSRTGQQMAGAQAQAQSQLAMRGGLQSGARDRMAMQGARDQMLGMQDVRAQGIGQRFGIHSQDQENRAKAMTGDRDLLGNMLGGDAAARNSYNLNRHTAELDRWGRMLQGGTAQTMDPNLRK